MTMRFEDLKQAVLHRDPVALVTDFAMSHDGLGRLSIPRREVWVVSHPMLVERVLKDSQNYGKGGDILDAVAADLGETGLFNVKTGSLWKSLRRLANPEFHGSQLEQAVQMTTEIWHSQMADWPKGKPVLLHNEFVHMNLRYLMQKMFGQSVSAEKVTQLAKLAEPVFRGMFTRISLALFLPPLARRLHGARDRLDSEVRQIIAAAKPGENDLLQRLKQAQVQQPHVVTDQVIRDQVFTLLMAGFDSTATVTSWAAIWLAEYPGLFNPLRRAVLESFGSRPLTAEAIMQDQSVTTYLASVLRQRPAFPLFFRMALSDQQLGDKRISKGATLVINLQALHGSTVSSFSIPFGIGQRMCPAERLAMVNMAVPLVELLRRYPHWKHLGDLRATRFTMTQWPRDRANMLLS